MEREPLGREGDGPGGLLRRPAAVEQGARAAAVDGDELDRPAGREDVAAARRDAVAPEGEIIGDGDLERAPIGRAHHQGPARRGVRIQQVGPGAFEEVGVAGGAGGGVARVRAQVVAGVDVDVLAAADDQVAGRRPSERERGSVIGRGERAGRRVGVAVVGRGAGPDATALAGPGQPTVFPGRG